MSTIEDVRAAATPRAVAYRLVAGIVAVVFLGLWLFEGYFVVTAWFPELYDELTPINGVAAGAFMTLMLLCALAALILPRRAIGPARVLFVGAGTLAVLLPLALVPGDPLVGTGLLVAGVAIVVTLAVLHPAREVAFDRRDLTPVWPAVALALVIAGPAVVLGVELQYSQLTLDDEIAQRWFYGGLSMYLLVTALLAGVASVDGRTRPTTGGAASLLAGLLGLVSIRFPGELHSFGRLGGALLVGWALAMVAVVVLVGRDGVAGAESE